MAASAYFETVQKIYIAFYQRPADPAGLKYWAEQIDKAGGNPNAVITAFGTSPEAQELYGDIDADTIGDVIDAVYQAAFGRAAEQEEIDYWAEGFNAGTITASSMALAVVLGAQNDDLATIDNKLEVANEFTAQVDGRPLTDAGFGVGPFAATYAGNDDAVSARDVLVDVTADPASIPAAEDITTFIQDTIADEGDPIVEPEPTTFALTAEGISVDEGQSIEFTVEASQPVEVDTVFTFAVGSTSATAADFTGPTAGTVTILAGETSATFSVTVAADNVAELAESFTVTLKDSQGGVVATESVDINDVIVDLTAPVVTAGQTFSYAENQAAGAVVGTVAATDAVGVTAFEFAPGSNAEGFFAIDAATGEITLTEAGAAAGAAANDFETTPNAFTLSVVAKDEAGNVSDAADVVINVTNVDDDAPVNQGTILANNQVTLTFNEPLSASNIPAASAFSGIVTTAGVSSNLVVTNVGISGSTVILTLNAAPANGSTVTVNYTAPATGALQDAAGNKVGNLTALSATPDTTAPTLTSATPADDSVNVAVGSNIVLTFSETVKAGTGNITIVNTTNAADSRVISVTDTAQVTFNGNTVTINPTADLLAGGNYAVNVAATAVTDVVGNAYAGIANNATLNFGTPGAGGTSGATIALTQGADAVSLTAAAPKQTTANDDLINGFLDGGSATFSGTNDTIDGGAGRDTLVAYGQAGAVVLNNVTNVEKIVVRTATAGTAVNMATAVGFNALANTELQNEGSTTNLAFTNIASTATTIGISGVAGAGAANTGVNAATASGFFYTAAAVAGANDTVKVALNGASANAGLTLSNGIENLVFEGTGAASAIAIVTDAADGNAAFGSIDANDVAGYDVGAGGTLTFRGTATVAVANAFADVKSVDGAASAGFTVDLSGAGGANQALTVVGGTGNDTVTVLHAHLIAAAGATKDSINLGDGTADRVILDTRANATTAATVNGVTSNVEILRFAATANTADALVANAYTNIHRFEFGTFTGNAATALAVTGLETADTVVLRNTGGAGTTAAITAAAGQVALSLAGAVAAQTANLDVQGNIAVTNSAAAGTNAITGDANIAKVVLTATTADISITGGAAGGNNNDVGGFAFSGVSVLDLTGNRALTIAGGAGAGNNAGATQAAFAGTVQVNAGSYTGNITSTGSAQADIFTTGSGNDNINGLAGADSINGGLGNDTLLGGADNDTLIGGEGSDSITGGAGNDRIDLTETTAAADTIVFSAVGAANGVDTIIGFAAGTAGADVARLEVGNTTAGTLADAAAAFTTISTALVTGGVAFNPTASVNTGAIDVVELTTVLDSSVTLTANSTGADLLQALSSDATAASGITVTADNDDFFLAVYQGGNAFLFHVNEVANAGPENDLIAVAGDITLVGVFNGVAAGGFEAGDFNMIANAAV